jgi:hypothetical protein
MSTTYNINKEAIDWESGYPDGQEFCQRGHPVQ